ncbi:hypothetical protein CK203_073310 [Vitis vinifera]|uniref:Uncharacterized protein n=1 Tax=Vitis vinifera TaxID=29760 RepID=A0A438ESJ9_VITVI|nr:hypothetical protein CK203_073310 [Vitis vinifera]
MHRCCRLLYVPKLSSSLHHHCRTALSSLSLPHRQLPLSLIIPPWCRQELIAQRNHTIAVAATKDLSFYKHSLHCRHNQKSRYLISDIPPSSSRVSNLQRHHCSHRHSTSTSVGATRVSNPNWNTCMFLTTAKDIWDAVHQTNSRALDAAQQELNHYCYIETKCPEDAAILKNCIEKDRVYDFLVGLNAKFDQVQVQILSKELSTLHETISIIQAKESKRSVMLEPQNMEGSAMVANKRLALLITK